MADAQVGNRFGYVDKRLTQGNDGDQLGTADTAVTYNTVENLRARLIAIGGVYTAAYVNSMTVNDMVYAVRLSDDAAGI